MTNEAIVDIQIESVDPTEVGAVEEVLHSVNPRRLEETRELVTILTVTAAAISLAKSLIELWKELRERSASPQVIVESSSGTQLNLTQATSERDIEKFISTLPVE
jgi:hypothetical protein